MILFAIAFASAGILAYEVLLTRMLAIIQWYHFAYLTIASFLFLLITLGVGLLLPTGHGGVGQPPAAGVTTPGGSA